MEIKKNIGKELRNILGESTFGKTIERRLIKGERNFKKPPLFIVGLPRTGSTLLYQLLCNNFSLSFFTNLSNVFYAYPTTLVYLTKPFLDNYSITKFESNYGVSNGLLAPSEAGGIYRYWFENKPELSNKSIQRTLHSIAGILNKPFIWKNLNLSLNLSRINDLFPNALFIIMKRELEYVVQSIYFKTVHGEGVNIKGLTKKELSNSSDLLKNLTERILKMDDTISTFFKRNDNLHIEINYKMLCENPIFQLNRIENKYSEAGWKLNKSIDWNKKQFPISKEIKMSNGQWERLQTLLNS